MKVLINEHGDLLEIDPKKTNEKSILVELDGYYEIISIDGYESAKYDFELKKWFGFGKQRFANLQTISETQKIWDTLDYLMKATEIIPTE